MSEKIEIRIHDHVRGYCDGSNCWPTMEGREQTVKRLPLGDNSGAFLCWHCWDAEMQWRKERNWSLPIENHFKIIGWWESVKE